MISLESLSAAIAHSFARRRSAAIKQHAADEALRKAKAEAAAEALRLEDERRAAVERQRRIERWLARKRVATAKPQDIAVAGSFRQRQATVVTKASIKAAEVAKADEAEIAAHREAERLRQHQQTLAWREELHRRQQQDIDGSREAKRAAEEQTEQARLDFLAAQLVRRTA